MRRPFVEQTWANFNPNFTATHQELRDTDTTVNELGFSSANAIVEKVVDQLRAEVPEVESEIVITKPLQPCNNLPSANATQTTSNPAIAILMASMMAYD